MFTKSQQALQFDGPYHSDFQIASVSTKWILLAVLNWMGSSGWVIDIWTHLLAHWCISVWFIFRWEVDWVYRSWTHLLVDWWNDLESAQCVDALYVQVNGLIDWSGNDSAEPEKYVCNFVVNFRRPNICPEIVRFSRFPEVIQSKCTHNDWQTNKGMSLKLNVKCKMYYI